MSRKRGWPQSDNACGQVFSTLVFATHLAARHASVHKPTTASASDAGERTGNGSTEVGPSVGYTEQVRSTGFPAAPQMIDRTKSVSEAL